ncbi:MAG: type III-B CRISPR-associated protein Cas10/Cmr2 [Desulfobacca sp.]|uniref:type III-B CRISPR-associated protein Cas10/Cmr2 n=1 Tax=Desulfobacca sp. TaxID=2067990 RepID=UPI00404988E1
MITWDKFKEIVSQQLAAAGELRFGHPLDPELSISVPSHPANKEHLQQLLAEACQSEAGCFLVGRLALEQRLNAGASPSWRYLLADGQAFWAKVQEAVILATFPGETPLSLLSLFVGPVQEFIREARKVRDLWAGSFLLAAATFQALTPLMENYGPDVVIQPHLPGTVPFFHWVIEQAPDHSLALPAPDLKRLASLPNRALALVPTDKVTELGTQAQEKVQAFWTAHADQVWQRLSKSQKTAISQNVWEQQVRDHFHCYFTAVPVNREALTQGYAAAQAEAQQLFEARKVTRSFPPWPTPDFRSKCTLCNHREIVGPGSRQESRQFWEEFVRASRGQLRPGEQLCATCLSKRLLRDTDLGVPPFAFDSTCDLAVRDYRTAVGQTDSEDFVAAAALLNTSLEKEEIQASDEIPAPWFYQENLETQGFLSREAVGLPANAIPEIETALEDVRRELKELQERLGPAPAYYAVLMLDGDEMGQWMSGAKPDPNRLPLTLTRHVSLSQMLTTLGREVMPALLGDWPGVLVYAGGDDLLALGPAAGVLAAAQRLQIGFREGLPAAGLLGLGPEAGISGGLVLAHHHDALEKVLETARQAERQAKEDLGRNALQVVIRFSTGSAVSGGFHWQVPLASKTTEIPLTDFIRTMAAWVSWPERGLSPRFLYRAMETLPIFAPEIPGRALAREPLKMELTRLLKRHLPADSPLWQIHQPFSPEEMLELLLFLADPQISGRTWPSGFAPVPNLQGLLKVALFLARENSF